MTKTYPDALCLFCRKPIRDRARLFFWAWNRQALALWQHAGQHGYVLVTRDADFYDLSLTRGAPPVVLWLRINNPDKSEVLRLLIDRQDTIREAFAAGATCVELWP